MPADPWAADVIPLLPFERRGAKLYVPGAVASVGVRAAEAEQLSSELAAAGMRATKVEDDELARFLETRGELVRLGPEHMIGIEPFDRAKEALSPSARRRERSRSLAFATSSGSEGATRSSCSSASTQDGVTRRVGDRRVLRRAAVG